MKGQRKSRKKEKIWMRVTYSTLESLFGARRGTIQHWIRIGKLDPTDIQDIINKYNNLYLLDHRTKEWKRNRMEVQENSVGLEVEVALDAGG